MNPHGDHGARAQDDELDPDEPRTPLWLPLLGLCLMVAGLIYALSGQKPEAPAPQPEAPSASAAAAPAPPS